MGGRASRQKGKRGEYSLRDYFRELGYKADRVPSSGAAEGFKGDVVIEGKGLKLTAELKVRQNEFKSIYALYKAHSTGALSCIFTSDGMTVVMSDSFECIGFNSVIYYDNVTKVRDKQYSRALVKVFNMHKFVKSCNFLVIKIDRQPFLFLRYIV